MCKKFSLKQRLLPSPALFFTISIFWLLMSSSFDLATLLTGIILGIVIPPFAARLDREFARIGSLKPLPRLLCVMLYDILLSNFRVAGQVLGPQQRLTPGFIWVPLDIGNIHGIATLTSLITLTPGTVSAALSDDRRYLLVHVLHLQNPQDLIDEIKTRYEAPLMRIFP